MRGGERGRSVGAFEVVVVVRKGMRGVSVWLGVGERLEWMRGGRGSWNVCAWMIDGGGVLGRWSPW